MGSLTAPAAFPQKAERDEWAGLQATYVNLSTPDVCVARGSWLLLSAGGRLTALRFLSLLCRISHSNAFNSWLKLFAWRVKV